MSEAKPPYLAADDFLPWEGKFYRNSPFKLLILGESHHHEGERFTDDKWVLFTRGTVEEYLDRTKRWFAGFTRKMSAVANEDYWRLDRQKFWHDVAFYNFVPGAPVDTPGKSPPDEWFDFGRERHARLLNELVPDAVFVFGFRLARHLERLYPGSRDSILSEQGTSIVLVINAIPHFISKHPSWSYPKTWRGTFEGFVMRIGKLDLLQQSRLRWQKENS